MLTCGAIGNRQFAQWLSGGNLSAGKAENSRSRWQRIEYWDLVCLFYWVVFFVSFCIVFDWPIDFRDTFSAQTWPRKVLILSAFWIGSVVIAQTIYGFWGSSKIVWRLIKSPFSATNIFLSFAWDSHKLFKKWASQFPLKTVFFTSLILTIPIGMTETDAVILSFLKPIIWIEIVISLILCFSWTLNPLPFLKKFETFKDAVAATLKAKAMQSLTVIEVSKEEDGQTEFIKRLDMIKGLASFIPKIMQWLSGPKLQFTSFLGIFLFGVASSLLLASTLLRIEHLTTLGGVFEGKFFSGSWQDYFYISLNHFVSAEVYNIDVISPNIRFVLSLLPVTSLTLTLLLVLVFTMVGQARVMETFRSIEHEILTVVSDAAKEVSQKKQVVLIDKRKEANQNKSVTSNETLFIKKNESDVQQSEL